MLHLMHKLTLTAIVASAGSQVRDRIAYYNQLSRHVPERQAPSRLRGGKFAELKAAYLQATGPSKTLPQAPKVVIKSDTVSVAKPNGLTGFLSSPSSKPLNAFQQFSARTQAASSKKESSQPRRKGRYFRRPSEAFSRGLTNVEEGREDTYPYPLGFYRELDRSDDELNKSELNATVFADAENGSRRQDEA
jgi:hypothetical protein